MAETRKRPGFKPRPVGERMFPKIDRSGGPDACWPWNGFRGARGYGHVWCENTMKLAHRVSWTLANGPIPDGLSVLHRCDNPPCCNPSHLFLGTQADNIADRDRKGHQTSGDNHWTRRRGLNGLERERLRAAGKVGREKRWGHQD